MPCYKDRFWATVMLISCLVPTFAIASSIFTRRVESSGSVSVGNTTTTRELASIGVLASPSAAPTVATGASIFYKDKYYFSGSSTYMYGTLTSASNHYVTIAFWITPSSTSSYCVLASSGRYTTTFAGSVVVGMYSGGGFEFFEQDSVSAYGVRVVGSTLISANQRSHVAVVKSLDTGYIYVNGVLDKSATTTNIISNPHTYFNLGGDARDLINYYTGWMDTITVYNFAMSASEILNLYVTPTAAPTVAPTLAPTTYTPTIAPTRLPTLSPTTAVPTLAPTRFPTASPTFAPSYVADTYKVATFAGTGTASYSGDGGVATSATINQPYCMAMDTSGNFYVAETANKVIRKISASTNIVKTFAGVYGSGTVVNNAAATSSGISEPTGIWLDSANSYLYVADTGNHRVHRINMATNIFTTFAGTGSQGSSGDGGQATSATLYWPRWVDGDSIGNIYISDTFNDRVRKVSTSTGIITLFAGSGGSLGDNGAATSAYTYRPGATACDTNGNVYVATDSWYRIRKVAYSTNIITTIAGTGSSGSSGDGGPATSAGINIVMGMYFYSNQLYLADSYNHKVRVVDLSTGIITLLAGTGSGSYSGDGGYATSAAFNFLTHAFVTTTGDVYVSDRSNHRIRKLYSVAPTAAPTMVPSYAPNYIFPTSQPTRQPSSQPSRQPTAQPTSHPTHTIYEYPPVAATANTFTASNAKEEGTYVISYSTSTTFDPYSAYNAFDRSSTTYYHFAVSYSQYYGVYQGSISTTTVNGTTYSGEYLQLKLPHYIYLTKFLMQGRQNSGAYRMPRKFVVLGSGDCSNWYLVAAYWSVTTWSDAEKTFSVSSVTTSYACYRLIALRLGNYDNINSETNTFNIAEWLLYGYPDKVPTSQPTSQPSFQPSTQPTGHPTKFTSRKPTRQPTGQPSSRPSSVPSMQPIGDPTSQPSSQPTNPTSQPSSQPTCKPSSSNPTATPTNPTSIPSRQPVASPTSQPSAKPTIRTKSPTQHPSYAPTEHPTEVPSAIPSAVPSHIPSTEPTTEPTMVPTIAPTTQPTISPTFYPTGAPTITPTSTPTATPTYIPTMSPTCYPTLIPTERPSLTPTCTPTLEPTIIPTIITASPTEKPSMLPSFKPSNSNDDNQSSNNDQIQVLLKAAIALLVIILVLLVIIAVFFCCNKPIKYAPIHTTMSNSQVIQVRQASQQMV